MEITEVKVFPIREQKLRAFVSIVLDGCFMVNDIKVIHGKDGLFISMPSRRKKNGRFKDIAHPLNNETRQAMEERIIAEYRQVAADGEAEQRPLETAPGEQPAAADRERPAAPPQAKSADGGERSEDKSLEEVTEAHLSDSYWTT